jgi:hypothetical protein
VSPRAYVPTEQQRAFELAVAEYLGIDPTRFVMKGCETTGEDGHVDLRAFVPAKDILFMFNNGRVPEDEEGWDLQTFDEARRLGWPW